MKRNPNSSPKRTTRSVLIAVAPLYPPRRRPKNLPVRRAPATK